MAVRKIIEIDESKCNGCGKCEDACSEGALKVVNGKAMLVNDVFCDGFGDCLGGCPTGALKIIQRDAAEFDEKVTKAHVKAIAGEEGVRKMNQAAERHAHKNGPGLEGVRVCPGTRIVTSNRQPDRPTATSGSATGHAIKSDLNQWPVQIHLVSPGAPFFKDKELVVLSTCSPIASADIHWRYMRGRSVVVGCPKLDETEGYAEKLGEILKDRSIPKVIIVRMEVPCCGGLSMIVREAVKISGRKDLVVEEALLSLSGDLLDTREL